MKYRVYWIISEDRCSTYIGFSDNIDRRIEEHRDKKVKSTCDFGNFTYQLVDFAENETEARKKEKYWKSCAGRKRLKKIF
ncbi:MAG: Excinuclease ABC subunit C [Candidatus Moranbacteria bacterium GW2011_GWE1_36_7]|nr:MAG: Excinuclease ABC subunit C [Candidatus Moranbacteria bacterium GW2011_GWD2_36_12]KKQ05514.1 MAG: Excinuclease ABC subunit C [Candidatus Moranbacteria bacterium GW2011_GWE2_36_40]KKQ14526.1 MAG: Excinuclease ABC subunit C [Candidatus Moranbacteria bacterium GW2011_GWE1_36_7]